MLHHILQFECRRHQSVTPPRIQEILLNSLIIPIIINQISYHNNTVISFTVIMKTTRRICQLSVVLTTREHVLCNTRIFCPCRLDTLIGAGGLLVWTRDAVNRFTVYDSARSSTSVSKVVYFELIPHII